MCWGVVGQGRPDVGASPFVYVGHIPKLPTYVVHAVRGRIGPHGGAAVAVVAVASAARGRAMLPGLRIWGAPCGRTSGRPQANDVTARNAYQVAGAPS